MPTGVAAGDNEIKQHRNFSETHFLGVAPCGFCLDRHDRNVVWDSRLGVCYPVRGSARAIGRGNRWVMWWNVTLSFDIGKLFSHRWKHKTFLYERIMQINVNELFSEHKGMVEVPVNEI